MAKDPSLPLMKKQNDGKRHDQPLQSVLLFAQRNSYSFEKIIWLHEQRDILELSKK